jgi:hypothetical protein
MTDDTTPLRVIYRRAPCGAVASVEIHAGDSLLLDTAADEDPDAALSYLLHLARDYYRADPHSDALPPDDAIVAAYWDHLA